MTTPVVATMRGITRGWREEAERRRRISRADSVADTLEYCAGELEAGVESAAVEATGETVTVEAYAAAAGVTPQSIRGWIRRGELTAHKGPKGYRIPQGAERRRAAS